MFDRILRVIRPKKTPPVGLVKGTAPNRRTDAWWWEEYEWQEWEER